MRVKALCRADLRDRVAILSDTATSDGQGGRTVTTTTLETVWASVEPWQVQGDETLRTGGVTPTARYRVRMRYRADVTPQMRVTWTPYRATVAKTLEISAVNLVSRDQIWLDCVEVAA